MCGCPRTPPPLVRSSASAWRSSRRGCRASLRLRSVRCPTPRSRAWMRQTDALVSRERTVAFRARRRSSHRARSPMARPATPTHSVVTWSTHARTAIPRGPRATHRLLSAPTLGPACCGPDAAQHLGPCRRVRDRPVRAGRVSAVLPVGRHVLVGHCCDYRDRRAIRQSLPNSSRQRQCAGQPGCAGTSGAWPRCRTG